MKGKILNLLVILTSLIGFLQWGKGNSMFLFQAEAEVLSKLFVSTMDVIHPLIMLPLLGQILLILTLFQKEPNKFLTLSGVCALGLLLGLMFFIGLIDLNIKILASTIPFLITVFFIFRHHKMHIKTKPNR
jgi:hypothetical protein